MGCDYEFLIQLLYNGVWVPVICLPSKTPTGGFPLQDALWQMALKKGVRGNYGIQYPESYSVDGFLWHEESKPSRVVAPKVAVKRSGEGAGTDEQDDQLPHKEEDEDDNGHIVYAYYSRAQMEQIAKYCLPSMSTFDMTRSNWHKDMLFQVVKNMDEAKRLSISRHLGEEIWYWGEDDDANANVVPDLLAKLADNGRRKAALQRVLTMVFRTTSLAAAAVERIAEYAVPVAEDVRVAWYDCEGWHKEVLRGDPAPPLTGRDPCCIQ